MYQHIIRLEWWIIYISVHELELDLIIIWYIHVTEMIIYM